MRTKNILTAAAALGLVLALGAPRNAAADTALGEATWSLEIGTDLGAGSSDGSIAVRRHMGAGSAWRFGIEAYLDKADGDGVFMETGSADEPAYRSDEYSNIAISLQWMRFASVRDNVTATFAIGPVMLRQKSSYGENRNEGTPGFFGYESRSESTEFGVDLGLGVEWFFTKRLSLGGQAGIRAVTGTADNVQIQRSGTGVTYSKDELAYELDTKDIEASTGRIKLTGYF